MKTLLFLFSLIAGFSVAAEPPEGATVVHMEATAQQKVTPDIMNVDLRIEHEAATAEDVQNYINNKMQSASQFLENQDSFSFSTGRYNVHQRWTRPEPRSEERERIWHGQQQITLEGREQTKILQAAGRLQGQGFAISNIYYAISPEVKQRFQDALLTEAVGDLKRRANRLARLLDKKKIHIARIDTSRNQPRIYAAKTHMMRAESAHFSQQADPVAKADEQLIELNVSAEIWLREE